MSAPSEEAWARAAEKRRAICDPPSRVRVTIGGQEVRGFEEQEYRYKSYSYPGVIHHPPFFSKEGF